MSTKLVDIVMPDPGEEGTTSIIGTWFKAPGDAIALHEPLLEIATDKVTLEIPCPSEGRLSEILVQVGAEVSPGDVLGRIDADADVAAELAAAVSSVKRGAGTAPTTPDTTLTDASTASASPRGRATGGARASHEGEADVSAKPNMPGAPSSGAAGRRNGGGSRPLSPAVRRLVKEHGIDPVLVSGSGRHGRVTVRDVQAFVDAGGAGAMTRPAMATSTGFLPPFEARSLHETPGDGQSRRVPHSPMRRGIADHMVRSMLQTAPHVSALMEVDFSRVLAHRQVHRAAMAERGVKLTLTAYIVHATVRALRAVPEANSRWHDDELELVGDCNLGIAVAIPGGLMVPVLAAAQTLDLETVADRLAGMSDRAREGRLELAEVQGGTFTITNHGMTGSLLATPIINQPQTAILGVGKLEKRVVVRTIEGVDSIQIRPMAYVTITFDHRAMDGFQANMFLGTFVETLESWPTP